MPRTGLSVAVALVVLLIGVSAGRVEADSQADKVEIGQHRTPAGHAFHYVQIADAKEVAIVTSWPSDWIDRGGAVAAPDIGARLMLEGGAGERDPAILLAQFQDLNAIGDLDAEADEVRGMLIALPDKLAEAAAIGRDVLVAPHLDRAWFRRIQGAVKADLDERQAKTSRRSWDTIRRFILGDHPLNDFHALRPASLVDTVTLDDIKAWHAAIFTTEDLKIVAAGPLKPNLIGEAIDQLLRDMPTSPAADKQPISEVEMATPRFAGKTILLHKPDVEKSMIDIVGPMPPTREPGHIVDLFATRVLGDGVQSRLFDAVRTKLRASYSFRADTAIYDRGTRLINLNGEVDTNRLGDALAVVEKTYEAFRSDGIGSDEFEIAKEDLAASFSEAHQEPTIMRASSWIS